VFIRPDKTPEYDGRTYEQTDRQTDYYSSLHCKQYTDQYDIENIGFFDIFENITIFSKISQYFPTLEQTRQIHVQVIKLTQIVMLYFEAEHLYLKNTQ